VNESHTTNQPASRDFLVIGYGNTLRGDDGAGPKVAVAGETPVGSRSTPKAFGAVSPVGSRLE
jgi:hypothetical protein